MGKSQKPDIFGYHDYRKFLNDWIEYQKVERRTFSLRLLAKESGLAVSYLSMMLKGIRSLNPKAVEKLVPRLSLSTNERSYFDLLIVLGNSSAQEARLDALERMKRFKSYRRQNPKEAEVYQYLTRWYYVAIREMAALDGFRADPEWIQERLRHRVDLKEIRQALDFLKSNGYLEVKADGTAIPPEKTLDCQGGVYRIALSQFHREMLNQAARSIDLVPREQRNLMGHAMVLDQGTYEQAAEIIHQAIEKIRALQPKSLDGEAVYYTEFALFPLTQARVAPETAPRRKGKK